MDTIEKITTLLSSADDSDAYLCVGVSLVVMGISAFSVPAASIVTGLVFCGLSFVEAKRGHSVPAL